jgi:hypothetical protein
MHDFFGDLVKIWVVVEGVTLDFDLKKNNFPGFGPTQTRHAPFDRAQ